MWLSTCTLITRRFGHLVFVAVLGWIVEEKRAKIVVLYAINVIGEHAFMVPWLQAGH